jgi:hypothetical protein
VTELETMEIAERTAQREVTVCQVCGQRELAKVLDLGLHPSCDDLVPFGDPRICREYPIEIVFCERCYTAYQRFPLPNEELFPASYHHRSRFTADVLRGLAQLVGSCEEELGSLRGKKVLDIGCNDGSLLDLFREKGAVTLGVEPTDAARESAAKGHAIYNSYLSIDVAQQIVSAHGQPDIITFTNVFAHIEDLRDVIAALKELKDAQTAIVIENHYLGAVLDTNQFDTFYHEHARTYSYTSFRYVAEALGMGLLRVEFPARYGGNIRVFLGDSARGQQESHVDPEIAGREHHYVERFAQLQRNVRAWREAKAQYLQEQRQQLGALRAKAFPARAAILIKLLGLGEESISAVYEKPGSLKIGHYVPGTRIPIRSDDELFTLPPSECPLLNLAWHIPDEIRAYLADHGYAGPVVDILRPADFAARSAA